MYVHEHMKIPVITVKPDALLDDALRTMYEHHIRRLPVVDNEKLVGLVTRHGLREALPSSAIPLSIWGIHYQLSKMKVRDVMITDVITVTTDSTVEEAVALTEKHKIGTLPVVDKTGNLVGIITSTDLLHLLAQLLGFEQKGARLHIISCSALTCHGQIMEILGNHKVKVFSAFSVPLANTQQEDFIIHMEKEKVNVVTEDLKKLGLEVDVREH